MRRHAAAVTIAAALITSLSAAPAEAASPVRFSYAQYDSPGDDTGSNNSLNAEWVKVTNHGSTARSLTGWTIRDTAGHVYKFPTFTLKAGKSVRVHTGRGSGTTTDLYWGQDYVWNNTGDKAILKTGGGVTVDTCSWPDGDGTASC